MNVTCPVSFTSRIIWCDSNDVPKTFPPLPWSKQKRKICSLTKRGKKQASDKQDWYSGVSSFGCTKDYFTDTETRARTWEGKIEQKVKIENQVKNNNKLNFVTYDVRHESNSHIWKYTTVCLFADRPIPPLLGQFSHASVLLQHLVALGLGVAHPNTTLAQCCLTSVIEQK